MFEVVVQSGMKSAVPEPVTSLATGASCHAAAAAAVAPPEVAPDDGGASTKAEGGKPPIPSASPACSAYGALTSSTRACCAWPDICTPTHRACSDVNSSAGNPSGF